MAGIKLALTMMTVAGLAGCGPSGDRENAAANASATKTATAEKPKHPTYCFFKDANTKGWSAARDKSGNVAVKGKVYLEDAGYKGDISQQEVTGDKASLWLTMASNTGYASPDGWWDVATTIPNAAAVKSVAVMCGTKTVATFALK